MKSEKVGARIRKFIKEKGLTQTKLAEITGLSQSLVSDIMLGKRSASSLIEKLVEIYGVSRDYLVEGIENNRNDIITSNHISENGLTKEERLRLVERLNGLYERHQRIVEEMQEIMKEVASVNRLLIVGTDFPSCD